MPRIRYLKPEFFSDEDLCSLSYQARLAFAGLWCYADKEGRIEDRPKFLKVSIFPYDNIDMEKQLQLLSSPKPFIHRYECDGKRYIQIINWDKHQRPHHTEKDSTFPPPPPLMEKGMEKGMGMEKQLNPTTELKNGDLTVKERNKDNGKMPFGEFQNVLMTQEELDLLISRYGETKTNGMVEELSGALKSKRLNYKDHFATVQNWIKKSLSNGGGKDSYGGDRKSQARDAEAQRLREKYAGIGEEAEAG